MVAWDKIRGENSIKEFRSKIIFNNLDTSSLNAVFFCDVNSKW